MTVQNLIVKNFGEGNGVTTKWPFTFACPEKHPEYIKVYIKDADGNVNLTTDFSVDMKTREVTYPVIGPVLPPGQKIVIARELPLHQVLKLVNQGPFFAEDLEITYDELVMMIQQLNEKLERTMSFSIDVDQNMFDPNVPIVAGKTYRVNAAGNGFEVTDDPAEVYPKVKALKDETQSAAADARNAANEAQVIKGDVETIAGNYDVAKDVLDNINAYKNQAQASATQAQAQVQIATEKASEASASASSATTASNTAIETLRATTLIANSGNADQLSTANAADVIEIKQQINGLQGGIAAFGFENNVYILEKDSASGNKGDTAPYVNWKATDYIYVGDSYSVTINMKVATQYCAFYDIAKQCIDSFKCQAGISTITIPKNVAYIRLSNFKDSFGDEFYVKYNKLIDNMVNTILGLNIPYENIYNEMLTGINDDTVVFTVITDSHIGRMDKETAQKHAMCFSNIAKVTKSDFMVHCGDMIQGDGNTTDMTDKMCYEPMCNILYSSSIPFVWCIGNSNHDLGATNLATVSGYNLNKGQSISLAGRSRKWYTNAKFNKNDTLKTYYYFDNEQYNIRFIVLDSDDYGDKRVMSGFSNQQIVWLHSVLLDARQNNLDVIIFSHIMFSSKLRWGGETTRNGIAVENEIAQFTSSGGNLIAYIYGHEHWDNYYYWEQYRMKTFSLLCDLPVKENLTEESKCEYGNPIVYDRVLGTDSEYAVNVFVVNIKSKDIKLVRFGAGTGGIY